MKININVMWMSLFAISFFCLQKSVVAMEQEQSQQDLLRKSLIRLYNQLTSQHTNLLKTYLAAGKEEVFTESEWKNKIENLRKKTKEALNKAMILDDSDLIQKLENLLFNLTTRGGFLVIYPIMEEEGEVI